MEKLISKLGINIKVMKIGVEPVIEKLKLLSSKTDKIKIIILILLYYICFLCYLKLK